MNSLQYSLSSSKQQSPGTLSTFSAGLPIQYGNTRLTLDFNDVDLTLYKYIKLSIEFENDPKIYSIYPSSTLDSITSQSIVHDFYGDLATNLTSRTITVTALKTNLQLDVFTLSLSMYKTDLTQYTDIKAVKGLLYDTVDVQNNTFLVLETELPRYLTNVIIPYTKDPNSIASILSTEPAAPAPLTGENILRMEQGGINNLVPIAFETSTVVSLCGTDDIDLYTQQEGPSADWPVT